MKKMLSKIVGTVLVGSLFVGGSLNVVNAYSDIKNSEEVTVNHTQSQEVLSDIYELSNGATLVINDSRKVYELFIDKHLCDWSYELSSKQELLKYNSMYAIMKDEYKKYNNKNVKLKSYKLRKGVKTYKYNNGVKLIVKGGYAEVYLPILGNLPYKTNPTNARKIINTYIEFTGDLVRK